MVLARELLGYRIMGTADADKEAPSCPMVIPTSFGGREFQLSSESLKAS